MNEKGRTEEQLKWRKEGRREKRTRLARGWRRDVKSEGGEKREEEAIYRRRERGQMEGLGEKVLWKRLEEERWKRCKEETTVRSKDEDGTEGRKKGRGETKASDEEVRIRLREERRKRRNKGK